MADLKTIAQSGRAAKMTQNPIQVQSTAYDQGQRKQFFARQTREYAREYGEIASNVYDAQAQGFLEDDFYAWRALRIRVSPAAQTATGETMPDDWQRLHVLKPAGIDTVPLGAYLTFGGNTWIVYKGLNMGSVLGDGIIRRCNAVIHTLDWYGNVKAVPMSYAKMGTLGNASHATENSIVAKNYIACVCQRNPDSQGFTENTRIILGGTAYSLRGVNDFTQEFTGETDSVHLMTFTIERSEVLEQDSIKQQCADYHSFRWILNVLAADGMNVGTTQQLQVISKRQGETVQDSEEHPISYLYESSDETVLTVDENGLVTAVGEGSATITVSLAQNPTVTESVTITAADAGERFIAFTSTPVTVLREYESVTIAAAVFQDGKETSESVSFGFAGPMENNFDVEMTAGENRVTVTAYSASQIPLTVTAEAGDLTTSMTIRLAGR